MSTYTTALFFKTSSATVLWVIYYIYNYIIIYVSGSRKRDLMAQIKKIEFFMLIKRYNISQLSAKILEGKTFDTQRNWQLNWALFSKAN